MRVLLLLLAVCLAWPAWAALAPAGVFADNLVLQQGRPVPVWGTAAPGAHVTVTFAGHNAAGVTDAQGHWRVALPALKASADPAVLTITDGTTTVTAKNVLVGEVWVCSGQSNMELHVRDVNNAAAEIAAGAYPAIREFDAARRTAPAPLPDTSGRWDVCTPAAVGNFSAAAYFFARELWTRLHVPVGLINASIGGTMAEPWTPRESVAGLPSFRTQYAQFLDDLKAYAADKTAYTKMAQAEQRTVQAAQAEWYKAQVMGDIGQREKWFDPAVDTKAWLPLTLPAATATDGWNYHGSVWVRRTVTVPADWVGKALDLHLGACDDVDITYVNGREVGRMWQDVPNFWKIPRKYVVPAELVTGTAVTIAVQIPNTYGVAGMFGTAEDMSLAPQGSAGAALSLAGAWQVRYGSAVDVPAQPQMVHSGMPGYGGGDPGAIYNGMIAPLQPFAIKGVLWYQGESNANEPGGYAELFPALVTGWRAAWGQGDFPFYFVQLAQYQARQRLPIEVQSWADLRDAQMHALALPHTGMAVAGEIGDAGDIHPKNKQELGRRLALLALAHDYGQKGECQGPTLKAWRVKGATVTLTFDHADGLHAESLYGFAVAGADKVFHLATATLKGKTVTLTSAVPAPVAVRYNWAFNPAGVLRNAAGLPASQFRTDTWAYDAATAAMELWP